MYQYNITVWRMCEEAAKSLTEIFTPIDVIREVQKKYPDVKNSTIRCQVIASSPNHPSSKHYTTTHRAFYYLGNGRYRFLKSDDKIIEKEMNLYERWGKTLIKEGAEKRINSLIENLDSILSDFKYREGPDLYFYRRIITEHKSKKLSELLQSNYFIELIYATLVSWDMSSRAAKMKYFDEFKKAIIKNKEVILELSEKKIDKLNKDEFGDVLAKILSIYDKLHVMKSDSRFVSNSKVLHFLLPNLVVPMDRKSTLKFFYENTTESRNKFRDIMNEAHKISKNQIFKNHFDSKWHTTIPKMIDNAIIGFMKNKVYR